MKKNKIAVLVLTSTIMTGMISSISQDVNIKNVHINKIKSETLLSAPNKNNNTNAMVVNGNGNLVLRANGNKNSKILSNISVGEMLKIHSYNANYSKVTVQETKMSGYISNSNLNIIKSGVGDTIHTINKKGQVINVSSDLNVRVQPTMASTIKKTLANGVSLNVIAKQGDWYKIDVSGTTGYVYDGYVALMANSIVNIENTGNTKSSNIISNSPSSTSKIVNKNSNTPKNITTNSTHTTKVINTSSSASSSSTTNTTSKTGATNTNSSSNTSIGGSTNKNTDRHNIVSNNKNDLSFNYTVNPKTFEITTFVNGVKETATNPMPAMKVTNFKTTVDTTSWTYPEKNINVTLTKKNDYLDVQIQSTTKKANSFTWANISGPNYTMPIGEGKYIPSNNADWKQYFNGYQNTTMSMLTMPFFAVNKKDYSIMYIMNDPLNNNISFNTKENINFNVNHEFTSINPNKTFSYRIYVTPNNSVNIAKTFKNYVVSKGEFTTLAQKEEKNPNVAKLIGAPEIYLWDSVVIQENNIRWRLLGKDMKAPLKNWIITLLNENPNTKAYASSFESLKPHGFIYKFDKEGIINGLTSICQSKELYNPKIFTHITPQIKTLLDKGVNNLTQSQLIQLNKMLLKSELGQSVAPVSQWSSASTTDMINDMKKSGINKLWVGLSDWTYAYMKPSLAKDANNLGYLIAPYDSYNMVEKQGDINSNTASFPGTNLYNNGVIENKNGQIVTGFHGKGRTLNPTLVFPEVKARVANILKNIPYFNSWFDDCDAAGQIYNDYSPSHTTTKQQDLDARIARMGYIANDKDMVVGSERGDSYASQVIDFAQGLESPPFIWMEQGGKDKNSPYYRGSYYAPTGGVPSIFGKQVPVRPWIKQVVMSPVYTIPLYKMVYNNSVITTNHWLWGTFKVKGLVKQRYLHDFLYNVPSLYHLDATAWANEKSTILAHNKVWAPFSEKVTNEPMTDFKVLTPDRLVQMTEYGNNVKVIANFSNNQVLENGVTIKPQSLVIFEGNKKIYYTPQILSNDL